MRIRVSVGMEQTKQLGLERPRHVPVNTCKDDRSELRRVWATIRGRG